MKLETIRTCGNGKRQVKAVEQAVGSASTMPYNTGLVGHGCPTPHQVRKTLVNGANTNKLCANAVLLIPEIARNNSTSTPRAHPLTPHRRDQNIKAPYFTQVMENAVEMDYYTVWELTK